MFWAGEFFGVGPVPCVAASPASSHEMPVVLPSPKCGNQNVSKYGHVYLGDRIAPSGEHRWQLRTGLYEAPSMVPGP